MGLFNKDLKIGAGERYDANRVAAEGVSKEEAAKDKKKLIKVFQAFDLNGDNTLDAVELARAMDYIDSLDEDGNGNDKGKRTTKRKEFLLTILSTMLLKKKKRATRKLWHNVNNCSPRRARLWGGSR